MRRVIGEMPWRVRLCALWLFLLVVGAIFSWLRYTEIGEDVLGFIRFYNPDRSCNLVGVPGCETGAGANETPSFTHFLGTDDISRDIFSRIVSGAQVSLGVAVTAVAFGTIFGGLFGSIAGFYRGRTETLLMTAIDIVLAFPGLVLLLAVIALFEDEKPFRNCTDDWRLVDRSLYPGSPSDGSHCLASGIRYRGRGHRNQETPHSAPRHHPQRAADLVGLCPGGGRNRYCSGRILGLPGAECGSAPLIMGSDDLPSSEGPEAHRLARSLALAGADLHCSFAQPGRGLGAQTHRFPFFSFIALGPTISGNPIREAERWSSRPLHRGLLR